MIIRRPTPNDDRSRVKNPTSPDYSSDRDNRSNQEHQNVPPPPPQPKPAKKP